MLAKLSTTSVALIASLLISAALIAPAWADPAPEMKTPALTQKDASTLYGSSVIPLITYLDQHREQDAEVCQKTWNDVRAAVKSPKFQSVPVPADLIEKAMASAKLKKLKFTADFLRQTLGVYLENQSQLANQHHFGFIDFDQPRTSPRLFIINLGTGEIMAYHAAAGSGSDPDDSGIAHLFSDVTDTHASSLGCFVAAGEVPGDCHGRPRHQVCKPTLRMHGIERGKNDQVCDRGIFFHPANYVSDSAAVDRSWGCPALSPDQYKYVFNMLGGGGLVCAMKAGPYTEAHLPRSSARSRVSHYRRSRTRRQYHGH